MSNEEDFLDPSLSDCEGPLSEPEVPRDGTFWVFTHNHSLICDGTLPRPNGKNVGLRRYHKNLSEGIIAWGKYAQSETKIETALKIVDLVARSEASTFLECFYSFEDSIPGSYLAVVLTNGRRAGRIWLLKTVVHTLTEVAGTQPLLLKGRTIYTHHFHDFVDKSSPNFDPGGPRLICKFTYLVVPLSGRCECGFTECEYFSLS